MAHDPHLGSETSDVTTKNLILSENNANPDFQRSALHALRNVPVYLMLQTVNATTLMSTYALLLWFGRWPALGLLVTPYLLVCSYAKNAGRLRLAPLIVTRLLCEQFRTHNHERQSRFWRHIWTVARRAIECSMESVDIVKDPAYVACADQKVLLCCFPHGCMRAFALI